MPVAAFIAMNLLLAPVGGRLETPPRVEKLSNGLGVVLIEDHASDLVSVQLWFRAGSVLDPPAAPGLCHVARHYLQHQNHADVRLRAIGCDTLGVTLRDACGWVATGPAEFLENLLGIQAERMRPPAPTPESAQQALRSAALDASPEDAALAALLRGHAYSRSPEDVSGLSALSEGALVDFLSRTLTTGAATLFVIGDMDSDAAFQSIRRRFGDLPWSEPVRPRYGDPPALGRAKIASPGPLFERLWLAPPASSFENAALDTLMERLCNEAEGVLTMALREKRAGQPTWRRYAWADGGAVRLSFSTPPGEEVDWADLVRKCVADAREQVPDESTHNRARTQAWRRAADGYVSLSARARRIAEWQMVGGDAFLSAFELPNLAKVSVMDVQRAAELLSDEGVSALPQAGVASARSQTPGPRRLDPGDALVALSEWTQGAPLPAGPKNASGQRHEISPRLTLTTATVAEAPLATILGRCDAGAEFTVPPPLPPRWNDYLSYRGATPVATPVGVGLTLPAEYAPQGLEIVLGALEIQSPGRRFSLVATGAIDPEDLARFVREIESKASPAPPSSTPAPAPSVTDSAPAGLRVLWQAGTGDVELRLRIPLGATSPMLAETIAWLLGAPSESAAKINGDTSWSWLCAATSANELVMMTTCDEGESVSEARRMLDRARDVSLGRFSEAELQQAIRLARAWRRLRLQDPAALAEALVTADRRLVGPDEPIDRSRVSAALAPALPQAELLVIGGSPAALKELVPR